MAFTLRTVRLWNFLHKSSFHFPICAISDVAERTGRKSVLAGPERLLEKYRAIAVIDLVMKHLDKLKASGALQIADRSKAAKRIREELFGKYTKEQLEAAT